MAERDPNQQTIEVISAAATPARIATAGRHFADPLTDAYSVAGASIGVEVRRPHAEVEQNLSPGDAIAAASDLMTYPVPAGEEWWRELSGPVVAGSGSDAVAVLPGHNGTTIVTPETRRFRRLRRGSALPPEGVTITGDLPDDRSWRALVWWSLARQRVRLWELLVLSALGGAAALLLPLATGALFSYALPQGERELVIAILLAFTLGSIGAAVVFLARNMTVIHLRDVSDATLSPGVMAHALRLPATFFRRITTGDMLNRLLSIEQARNLVDDGVPSLIVTSVFGLVNLVLLALINPMLALLITVGVAIVVLITLRAQIRARAAVAELLESRSQVDAGTIALADSLVPIRVAGAESRAMARWSVLQSRAIEALSTRMRSADASAPILAAGPLLVNIVLVIAVVVVGSEALPLSRFMPAYAAVVQLTVAMGLITANLVRLWEIGPVLSRLTPITTSPIERPGERRPPGPLEGSIELRDVSFGYDRDRPPLFEELSLTVEPGEFVAVVGPSGSGKSTILRLILGFEEPWSGVVSYDHKDLAEVDVAAVRRQIGTVLQSSIPFGVTVRECVCGPLQLTDDELWQVLADAGLADDVAELPHRLDTPIGERGGAISGGQRQRLMIARALAGKPRILLLDEATSALDNITQEVVMQALLAKPITRIAVAHRLTTIENADRVLVVSDGRIVESGPPEELRRTNGHFARLAARQEF